MLPIENSSEETLAPRLVYIDGGWAYFYQGEDWKKVGGLGWDTVGYAYNSHIPMDDLIFKVAFEDPCLRNPDQRSRILTSQSCKFTAVEINSTGIPWLSNMSLDRGSLVEVLPGCSFGRFKQLVAKVYELV